MRAVLLLVCWGLVAGFQWKGSDIRNTVKDLQPQDKSEQEAQRVWEQAIAAKGGRQRLDSVRNMVVSHAGQWNITLYVFPNKLWQWSDDRPTALGLSVEMHNLERRLAYFVDERDLETPINKGWGSNVSRGAPFLADAQLYYLLETQWVKPKLVMVATGHVGHQKTDVVKTVVNGSRVDFHLDPKSHLPLEVAFPSRDSVGTTYGRGTYYVTLSDYREESGIQMPHQVGFMTEKKVATTFEINVDYNEQIFEHAPSIKAGPDAWRSPKQKN